MIRTAAEILRDMENRVARLERAAGKVGAAELSAEEFAEELQRMIKKHFPKGVISVKAQESLGRKMGEEVKDILIRMTVLPKEEWESGISMNDPFYTQIWVWDAEGVRGPAKTELSVGGIFRFKGLKKKVPFRSAQGTQEKVLKSLEAFIIKAASEWELLQATA